MTLADFTEQRLLVPRLESDDQAGAINELVRRLDQAGRIEDSLAFFQAVMQREYVTSTLAHDGVAFPHARRKGARSMCFAIGLSPGGIPWGNNDLARVIVLLAVPVAELQMYLKLVGVLARLIRDEREFARLRQCRQPEEMLRVLESVPLKPTVTAAGG